MLLVMSVVAYSKTDDELRASNQVEFFVMEADGTWWSMTYSANGTIGNKYLNEVIEGVQLCGIRVDKVGEYRYQLIPETQEQFDLLCGYETTFYTQILKLHSFLRDVESPTANERIAREKKQTEEKKQAEQKQIAFEANTTRLKNKSTDRWADVINYYIYDNGNNTFNTVD